MFEVGLAAPPFITGGLPSMLGRRCSARLDLKRFWHDLRSLEAVTDGTEVLGMIVTASPRMPYVLLMWLTARGPAWIFCHKFEITGLEE
jgi:hypothetical protein